MGDLGSQVGCEDHCLLRRYLHELGERALSEVEVVNMEMKEKKEHKADWFVQVGKAPV